MSKPAKKQFKKVLIANRGEIACRVIQGVQEMGMLAVALYSDPDKQALHVRLADEAFHLPGKTPAETYLQAERILAICKENQIDAVHPGYGFLSENAEFARACEKAGITFIGPTPDVIHKMGDKIISKETMQKAGVPVVPGWAGDLETDYKVIEKEADKIGYPLLVKAAAGGGGKGMRRVDDRAALKSALEAAGREAKKAFGDARVFLEKYITRPRHIEFQIFGDSHGNAVHLFERECSIQRRYQKIIEESPSPALTPELRAKMGDAAVKAAKALGYQNAGTVEFIVSDQNEFYFLEVNTRLQVEHPVTEMVTHLDLVRLQLQVAMGEALPFKQEELKQDGHARSVRQDGHAIECRIYAEDAANNFMPSVGKLQKYRLPVGPGIRVDNGYPEGYEVTVYYDPMLAKLIVWGEDRGAALAKMRWALEHFVALGVTTNIEYLKKIIEHPEFVAGRIHTHFLNEHAIETDSEIPPEVFAVEALVGHKVSSATAGNGMSGQSAVETSPWQLAGRWRGGA